MLNKFSREIKKKIEEYYKLNTHAPEIDAIEESAQKEY